MKKKICLSLALLVIVISIFSLVSCTTYRNLTGNPDDLKKALDESGYQLVFEDEFNGTEIDRNVWQGLGENGQVRRGAYYYNTEENAFVENGNLILRTFYQSEGEEVGWHTSWLESKTDNQIGKGFSAKYGYFEARCIAPPCEGIWSAFWLLPDEGVQKWDGSSAEDGVEIDIMESPWFTKGSLDGNAQFVVHTDYSSAGKAKLTSDVYRIKGMFSEFHTYGVMWTPTDYTWYVDGRKIMQSKHIYNGIDYGTSKVKQYPVLSVEVFGDIDENGKPVASKGWAGNPNNNSKTTNYDFIIDYVRVYQIKE